MTPALRRTEVGGRPASYREAGAGLPVVVTAGLGLSSRFYEQSYGPFAAAGLRLIVPDLPGWGDTPGARTGLSAVDSARFLIDFARALGIRHAVWIGHSLGAQAVVELAARRPDLAGAIVLVGPTGAPGRFRLLRQARGLAAEAVQTPPDVIRAVAREYLRTPPWRYIGTWLRHGDHDVLHVLPRVQCPATILVGDDDPVCSPAFVELLRHRLPHGRVQWIPGATHGLPRASPDVFNHAVINAASQNRR